jgi:hypothetical protein
LEIEVQLDGRGVTITLRPFLHVPTQEHCGLHEGLDGSGIGQRVAEDAQMPDEEPGWRLHRDALVVLTLPPDDQLRINGPGCVTCDLISDFDAARNFMVENAAALTEVQRLTLDRIKLAIDAMKPQDVECCNNEVIRRPAWQEVRQLATDALLTFGWDKVELDPYVEVQRGVWHRPYEAHDLDAIPDRFGG